MDQVVSLPIPAVPAREGKGRLMRKIGVLVALPLVGALLGVAPAAAQPTPEATAFCDAALKADRAVAKVASGGTPKQEDVQAAETALGQVETTAPPEIVTQVQAVVAATRTGIQSGQDPREADPSFEQNFNAMEEYRYNSCGYTQLEVTGVEYEFQGLPKTMPAGTVAIRFTDTGAEIHELAIYRMKTRDSLKKVIGLSEKEQSKKLQEVGGTFAMQNQTTFSFAELTKPGRYAVICHLPVGSTSIEAAEGAGRNAKSHADEGMYATITVEKGSTTTTAAS
jgi:hypothetical protein